MSARNKQRTSKTEINLAVNDHVAENKRKLRRPVQLPHNSVFNSIAIVIHYNADAFFHSH